MPVLPPSVDAARRRSRRLLPVPGVQDVQGVHDVLDALAVATGSVAVLLRTGAVDVDGTERAATILAGAARAAQAVAPDLRISPVVPLPAGPLVRLDDLPADEADRLAVGDALADAVVAAHGHPDDLVAVPLDGLADLDAARRAVVLRLFPTPGRGLPPEWVDLAAEWAFGGISPSERVRLRVLGVEVAVAAADAPGVLHAAARVRAWCDAVGGDPAVRLRSASASFGIAPHVALAAGGAGCDDQGLLARLELLAEVAVDVDEAAWAGISIDETFAEVGTGLARTPWTAGDGASANRVAGRLVDRYVPDAFCFQVLGRSHLAALGPGASGLPGRTDLGDGRVALWLGEPADWLPDADPEAARAAAQHVLAPLLLHAADLEGALARAGRGAEADPGPGGGGTSGESAGPDIDQVVLEPHAHPRRGRRLSVLELVAWLAGEPHTDSPRAASPVVSAYLRDLAIGLDDDLRQRLAPLAAAVVGTGPVEDPARDPAERHRCWLLADRLLRGHAPRWLAAAGLEETAAGLSALGSVEDDNDLVRGVALLGDAIVEASAALDALLAAAGSRADAVDQAAWEVWEEVAQASGWAATTDAVAAGLPGDLTFATDQRVMECSRDLDQREALTRSTRGLGDEVWATALSGLAALAWRSGWEAAEAVVHHETSFSVRTTLKRSLHQQLAEAGQAPDDVTVDMVLDDVDDAARDVLARLLLVGDDRSDWWERGVAAGASVPDGEAWQRAVAATRDALGPNVLDEALAVARAELARWADRAPQVVARAVVASVTREACSVAGRLVAGRAALDALLAGGDHDAAVAAASEACADHVDDLARDALALAAELVGRAGPGSG